MLRIKLISFVSLKTNITFNGRDAGVQGDGVLLKSDSLLDELVSLLLEEVNLIDVLSLEVEVVFFKVGDVFDDLLQDVIGGLGSVML